MSYIKCTSCKKKVFKYYSNPNIHYSSKENNTNNFKCSWCENYESLKVGDWYQDEKGEYHQKKKSKQ